MLRKKQKSDLNINETVWIQNKIKREIGKNKHRVEENKIIKK